MHYPMTEYDRYGARQLPEEAREPIGQDMFNNDLYGDEIILINEYDIVLEEDLSTYKDVKLERMSLMEKVRRIQMLSSLTVTKDQEDLKLIHDLLDDILSDKIQSIGIAEYFNLTGEKASEAL